MIDRGIIKWQPFNSCFNTLEVMEEVNDKKARKQEMIPKLSEDQLINLDSKIREAYNLKLLINIEYYYDGEIKNLIGKITSFDYLNKKIYINKCKIYFNQILKIKEI